MDGQGESLCTDGNPFLVLHSHSVCNGKPPDEAETFLMAKNTTHTGQENSALLPFRFRCYILNLWHCYTKRIKSFALGFYRITVIQTSFST